MMDSVMAFLQSLQGWPAYALLFGVLAASGFGLPVNEDILVLTAAALTLRGVMEPVPLVIVAWCGILVADSLVFYWGWRFGARLLAHPRLARWVPAHRLAAMQSAVLRYGPASLFAVRFMPGLRSPLYFAAGSLKLPYRQMLLCDGAAAAIELPLLVYLVRAVGGNWQAIVERAQGYPLAVAVAALAAVGLLLLWRRLR